LVENKPQERITIKRSGGGKDWTNFGLAIGIIVALSRGYVFQVLSTFLYPQWSYHHYAFRGKALKSALTADFEIFGKEND
jgi:hypothetical protein